MDKTIRNDLLIELADINSIIERLESELMIKGAATDLPNQLLQAHDIKVKILLALKNF